MTFSSICHPPYWDLATISNHLPSSHFYNNKVGCITAEGFPWSKHCAIPLSTPFESNSSTEFPAHRWYVKGIPHHSFHKWTSSSGFLTSSDQLCFSSWHHCLFCVLTFPLPFKEFKSPRCSSQHSQPLGTLSSIKYLHWLPILTLSNACHRIRHCTHQLIIYRQPSPSYCPLISIFTPLITYASKPFSTTKVSHKASSGHSSSSFTYKTLWSW